MNYLHLYSFMKLTVLFWLYLILHSLLFVIITINTYNYPKWEIVYCGNPKVREYNIPFQFYLHHHHQWSKSNAIPYTHNYQTTLIRFWDSRHYLIIRWGQLLPRNSSDSLSLLIRYVRPTITPLWHYSTTKQSFTMTNKGQYCTLTKDKKDNDMSLVLTTLWCLVKTR